MGVTDPPSISFGITCFPCNRLHFLTYLGGREWNQRGSSTSDRKAKLESRWASLAPSLPALVSLSCFRVIKCFPALLSAVASQEAPPQFPEACTQERLAQRSSLKAYFFFFCQPKYGLVRPCSRMGRGDRAKHRKEVIRNAFLLYTECLH